MQIDEFKAAVGKFPTGVTVISTSNKGKFFGFTANSFVSVSLTPSLISFCLDKTAGSFEAFKVADYFAISILAGDQEKISTHFSSLSPLANKFIDIDYEMGSMQCPLILGAVCWLECSKYDQFECGDHYIFIGKVQKAKINNKKSPLVYFARSYQAIT